MKFDRKKKILAAIFATSTIIGLNTPKALAISKGSYIEEGNLIIKEFESYTITIDEEELTNAKDITIKIGDKIVSLNSQTIQKLKEEAKKQEEELQKYKVTVYTSLGIITVIVLKTNIKKKRK